MLPILWLMFAAWIPLAGCTGPSQELVSTPSLHRATNATASKSPVDVVNRRMSAYNRHDFDAFRATYSASVEFYTYPRTLLGKGEKHTRWVFEEMFEKAAMQVEVHHQMAIDNFVVNEETVNYGNKTTQYVSIYEVRDGLIQSVTFVRN